MTASQAPTLAARTEGEAIDRYFQASLLLLVVTAFATLAGTGRLDLPSMFLVTVSLVARGYLLAKGRSLVLSERATTRLTLGYVLFYLLDFFFITGNFVSATVHLVLFSMVIKIFSVQRERDHLYLAVLSFLMVLAAAVLTVDSLFLAAFCLFLVLAVTTFSSMEMRRSYRAALGEPILDPSFAMGGLGISPAGSHPGSLPHPRDHARKAAPVSGDARRMAWSLSFSSLWLAVGVVGGAFAIFFVLPRISAGYFTSFAPHTEIISGFSDEVRLGQIGEIKQTDTVVMHVQVESGQAPPDLKWRGIALARFDGKRWSNPEQSLTLRHAADGRFYLNSLPPSIPQSRLRPAAAGLLDYRILMEPVGTAVFFFAPVPLSFSAQNREIAIDLGGAVYNSDHERMISSYRARSYISPPGAQARVRHAQNYPPAIAWNYLELPVLDARIPKLAEKITAGGTSDFEKAAALEEHLRSSYGYTLQLLKEPEPDPLAHFLFVRKQGHCEYFASAMAIMLRTLGIPSRIVNGFRNGEYNDLTGSYIIRGRNAHSWVEAYIAGDGWVTFDPTPADPLPPRNAWSRALLFLDAMREFWREWIINYDFSHQNLLGSSLNMQRRRLLVQGERWWRQLYRGWVRSARRLVRSAVSEPGRWLASVGIALAALLLLVNLRRLWRLARDRRLARRPERAPQAAAGIWYQRLIRVLARRGWRKTPAQTPQEFLGVITDAALRDSVANFTLHYERARFGDSADDARRLPQLYAELAGSKRRSDG